jgi:hypothetical protein
MATWQTYDGRVYDDDGTLVEVDGEDPPVEVDGVDPE